MASRAIDYSTRFKKDYKRLDPQTQGRVDQALKSLQCDSPFPKALRHHTLHGYRPTIHVIDVSGNHSHQITFRWDGGDNVSLLRVGTHSYIDRSPD